MPSLRRNAPLLALVLGAAATAAVLWVRPHGAADDASDARARAGAATESDSLAAPALGGLRGEAGAAAARRAGGRHEALERVETFGRVEALDGTPIAGASVRAAGTLEGLVNALFDAATMEARTDAAGRFHLTVPRGTAALYARAEGFTGHSVEPRPFASEVLIRLASSSGFVAGTVRDGEGRAVAGARVVCWASWDHPDAVATTGSDGAYRVSRAHDGPVTVSAWARGFQVAEEDAPALLDGDTSRLDFVLDAGVLVRGRVIADDTGLGVPGAVILPPYEIMEQAVADASGSFEIAMGASGSLRARAPGFDPGSATVEEGADGAATCEVRLVRHVAFAGIVLDERGRPLAGAEVRAGVGGEAARTGPDGRFRVLGSPPGVDPPQPTLLLARGGERTPGLALVTAARRTDVTLALAPPAPLTGRVVDGTGAPRPDARVSVAFDDPSAPYQGRDPLALLPEAADEGLLHLPLTADGRFRASGLPAGNYRVSARSGGRGGRVVVASVRVDPAEPSPPLELVLEEAAILRGRVLDGSGAPVRRAEVHVWFEGSDMPDLLTDRDGRFEARGVPLEPVEVSVMHDDHDAVRLLADPRDGELRVVLERVPVWTLRVHLTGDAPADGSQIRLHAAAAGGPGCLVEGAAPHSAGGAVFRARGKAGEYRLAVVGDEVCSAPVRFVVPEGAVEVAVTAPVRPTATIAGVVVDPEGVPLDGATIYVSGGAGQGGTITRTDDQGRFTLPRMYASRHTLYASAPRHAGVQRDVEAGDEDLVIVLLPSVLVRGRVDPPGLVPGRLTAAFAALAGPPSEPLRVAADGSFAGDLVPGTYEAFVLDAGREGPRTQVVVERGRPVEGLVLSPPAPGRVIRGRVLLPGGQPAVGFLVSAAWGDPDAAGAPQQDTRGSASDAAGRFEITGLADRAYDVRVDGDVGAALARDVTPDGPPLDLRLVAHGAIAGEVRRGQGGAVEAEVLVADESFSDSVTASRGGRFLVRELPPGQYRLWVLAGAEVGWLTEPVRVAAGRTTSDVRIELVPCAVVEGLLTDEHGRPVPEASIESRCDDFGWGPIATTDAHGRFRLDGLLPGAWTVYARLPDPWEVHAEARVEVRSGETTQVRLRPPPK